MNTDDVITAFATAGNDLPREAMQWTLDNWEDALPTLLQRLDAYTDGTDRSDEASETLFYFLHLCAEKNEARAFPSLCRFLADAAAAEHVLADAKTMTLSGMLIGTFNGDTALLRQLIEDPGVDEYVRSQALGSMAYLTRSGRIADAEMRACLLYLFDAMQPRGEHVVWWGWVDAAGALGYADLEEQAKSLFERKFVSEGWTDLKYFHEDLAASEDEAMQAECFKRGGIAPLTDAIGELSGWYGFSAEAKQERERAEELEKKRERKQPARPVIPAAVWGEPIKNPLRNVGRNDPCPCGSGKKYKKCCLAA